MKKMLSTLLVIVLMLTTLFTFASADETSSAEATDTTVTSGAESTEPTVTESVYYDETGDWVTANPNTVFINGPDSVTLSGTDAIAAYAPQLVKEEGIGFMMNADLSNGAWPAIALRMDNYERPVWHENSGYLIVFKEEKLEFQRFGDSFFYDEVPNNVVFSGVDHEVRITMADVTDGVRIRLFIDQKLVYEWEDLLTEENHPILEEGYFGLYAMSGKPLTVKNFTLYDEQRVGGWAATHPDAVLTATSESEMTLSGQSARAAYEAELYQDASFEFTFNADLADGAWPSIALRMQNYDTDIWYKNAGYLIGFKSDIIEIQRFGRAHFIDTVENTGIFNSGTNHRIRVSTANVEGGVRVELHIDGTLIYEFLDTEAPILEAGYFGLLAYAGPATIKNFTPREEVRVDGWVTSIPTSVLESIEGGVSLSGNSAVAAYDKQRFQNEEYTFTFNAELEDGAWPGFAMRLNNYDKAIWDTGNSGYLIAFKADIIEVQKFGKTFLYESFDNTGIFNSGVDHEIRASVADVAEGVKITLVVDGVKVAEVLDEEEPNTDPGYFAIYAYSGKRASLTDFEASSASDAYIKGALEELRFTDVAAHHPAYASIHFLAYTQVVTNDAVAFEPDASLTLGSFVDTAMKAMCHTVQKPCEELVSGEGIEGALEAGLMVEGEFDLQATASKSDMLTVLSRALSFSGVTSSKAALYESALADLSDDAAPTKGETAELLMRFIHVY